MRVLMVAANRERSPDPVAPLGAAMVAGAVRAAGHDLAFSDLCFAADPLAEVAAACAVHEIAVISGGARGADLAAMTAALGEGGRAVGVMADSLEKHALAGETREAIEAGVLTLVTPYSPSARFDVGLAMGRNKLIYALADWALVVHCEPNKGGSWAGAVEALRAGRTPVFVREDAGASSGRAGAAALLKRGARAFPPPPWDDLAGALSAASSQGGKSGSAPAPRLAQGELF